MDKGKKIVLQVGCSFISRDFRFCIADMLFLNFSRERNVPCSSEGAWVYEWRVEDVGFVDYVVLVLLDFDECFLGLG